MEPEFPTWRKAISTAAGAAMFLAFIGMCFFATKSWYVTAIFGVLTLWAHFRLARRTRG